MLTVQTGFWVTR